MGNLRSRGRAAIVERRHFGHKEANFTQENPIKEVTHSINDRENVVAKSIAQRWRCTSRRIPTMAKAPRFQSDYGETIAGTPDLLLMRPTAASLHAHSRRRKQRTERGPETGLALGEPKGNQNYFLAELVASIKNNIKPKTTKNAFFLSHLSLSDFLFAHEIQKTRRKRF